MWCCLGLYSQDKPKVVYSGQMYIICLPRPNSTYANLKTSRRRGYRDKGKGCARKVQYTILAAVFV